MMLAADGFTLTDFEYTLVPLKVKDRWPSLKAKVFLES